MMFRDQEQRKKFSVTLIHLGERAGSGDGHTLRRLGEDLLAPSQLNGLGIVEAIAGTSSVTMRQLLLPMIMALAHGPDGVDAWLAKNNLFVQQAEQWMASLTRGPAAPSLPQPSDNGLPLSLMNTGIPPQVTG